MRLPDTGEEASEINDLGESYDNIFIFRSSVLSQTISILILGSVLSWKKN